MNNFSNLIQKSLFTVILISFIFGCEQSDPDSNNSKRIIKDSGDFIFSGFGWKIKSSNTPVGPGPNIFDGSDSNVWVDDNGYLHLKITNKNGKWQSSEVICTENTGYGTYIFTLGSDVSKMNENIVFGLFTWDNNTFYSQGNSEVDIEFAKWFKANDSLLLTTSVQPVVFDNAVPFEERTHKPQMNVSKLKYPSTHAFDWRADNIEWNSYSGRVYPGVEKIASWNFSKSNQPRVKTEGGKSSLPIVIPEPGSTTNARINLWLLNGRAPSDGKPFEVIIERFDYLR